MDLDGGNTAGEAIVHVEDGYTPIGCSDNDPWKAKINVGTMEKPLMVELIPPITTITGPGPQQVNGYQFMRALAYQLMRSFMIRVGQSRDYIETGECCYKATEAAMSMLRFDAGVIKVLVQPSKDDWKMWRNNPDKQRRGPAPVSRTLSLDEAKILSTNSTIDKKITVMAFLDPSPDERAHHRARNLPTMDGVNDAERAANYDSSVIFKFVACNISLLRLSTWIAACINRQPYLYGKDGVRQESNEIIWGLVQAALPRVRDDVSRFPGLYYQAKRVRLFGQIRIPSHLVSLCHQGKMSKEARLNAAMSLGVVEQIAAIATYKGRMSAKGIQRSARVSIEGKIAKLTKKARSNVITTAQRAAISYLAKADQPRLDVPGALAQSLGVVKPKLKTRVYCPIALSNLGYQPKNPINVYQIWHDREGVYHHHAGMLYMLVTGCNYENADLIKRIGGPTVSRAGLAKDALPFKVASSGTVAFAGCDNAPRIVPPPAKGSPTTITQAARDIVHGNAFRIEHVCPDTLDIKTAVGSATESMDPDELIKQLSELQDIVEEDRMEYQGAVSAYVLEDGKYILREGILLDLSGLQPGHFFQM